MKKTILFTIIGILLLTSFVVGAVVLDKTLPSVKPEYSTYASTKTRQVCDVGKNGEMINCHNVPAYDFSYTETETDDGKVKCCVYKQQEQTRENLITCGKVYLNDVDKMETSIVNHFLKEEERKEAEASATITEERSGRLSLG